MTRIIQQHSLIILLLSLFCQVSLAQFNIVPLKNAEKIRPSSAKMVSLKLPFFDDFSASINRPDQAKWQNNVGVSINNTSTNDHPTLNVATFDGLKADGNPYDFVNALSEGPTDALTSRVIDLSSNPARGDSAYTVKDSLHLSFFYRGQGLGDRPDLRDSLRLQFLTNGNIWKTVWIDSAQTISNQFKRVIIPIRANLYLHSEFQFRFQSFGRQSGQFDVWHLDYVYLDEIKNVQRKGESARNSSERDSFTKEVTSIFTRDFAARNQPTSPLKNYSAMPMWQFLAKPEKELAEVVKIDVGNLSPIELLIRFSSYTVKNLLTNQIIQRKDAIATTIPLKSTGTIEVKSNLNLSELKKDTARAYLQVRFDVESGDLPPFTVNDTINRFVDLNNYYAYDDGTAEQAAEIKKGFGRVAVQFINNKPDAVKAIRINLQPTVKNISKQRLTFQILANDRGKIGRVLRTISDTLNTVKYSSTQNDFVEYKIDPVAVPDTFYVGFIQFTDDEPLAIGLDLNTPQFSSNHYYNINNEWVQVPKADVPQVSSTFVPIKGSLMIRPVMLGKTVAAKPLANAEEIQERNLVISPNPSSGIFKWNDNSLKDIEVYDMTGKNIHREHTDNQEVNLQSLRSGIYFLRLSNEKNTFVRKIVKE